MKNFLQSPKTRAILVIIAGVIVLLVIFAFGASVGYHRGLFASRFGRYYAANFYGGPAGKVSFTANGVAGDVIAVSSATIAVEDRDGDEQFVTISPDTLIREANNTVLMQDMNVGDTITVIGEPNGEGQIQARFIRLFPGSSSMPFPPPPVPVQIFMLSRQGQQ